MVWDYIWSSRGQQKVIALLYGFKAQHIIAATNAHEHAFQSFSDRCHRNDIDFKTRVEVKYLSILLLPAANQQAGNSSTSSHLKQQRRRNGEGNSENICKMSLDKNVRGGDRLIAN